MTDIGCKFKEMCDAYQKKTPYTTCEMDYKFCETTPKRLFVKGFCPMYDLQSELISLVAEILSKTVEQTSQTAKTLETTLAKIEATLKEINHSKKR